MSIAFLSGASLMRQPLRFRFGITQLTDTIVMPRKSRYVAEEKLPVSRIYTTAQAFSSSSSRHMKYTLERIFVQNDKGIQLIIFGWRRACNLGMAVSP